MTSISGRYIKITPCCGATYSTPRYSSMNFMASAFWTDGYREQSLMPNDHGLRKCKCGRYYLQRELVPVGEVESTDVPLAQKVQASDLPNAISNAKSKEVEIAARLDYWQELNHTYREKYREHRAKEDEDFEASNRWKNIVKVKLMKLLGTEKSLTTSNTRKITFPVFKLTDEQRSNISALLSLLAESDSENRIFMSSELYRQLGEFKKAAESLAKVDPEYSPTLYKLLQSLINDKECALVRYRAL